MKPRITLLTLGVDDLERSLIFYREGLGLPTRGSIGKEFEHGAIVFIDLQPGLKFALWNRADLAWDTGLRKTPASLTEFSIAHNVNSKSQVDEVMLQAARAGATITKPAHDTFYGAYVTSRIPTAIYGKSPGTLKCWSRANTAGCCYRRSATRD